MSESTTTGSVAGELVFTRKGKPISSFRKAWSRACIDVSLARLRCRICNSELDKERNCATCKTTVPISRALYEGLIFHDLRRTGVRNLVRAGVPERVAQAISGHKTRTVFERYNIVSEQDLTDAVRKLQKFQEAAVTAGQPAQAESRVSTVRSAFVN